MNNMLNVLAKRFIWITFFSTVCCYPKFIFSHVTTLSYSIQGVSKNVEASINTRLKTTKNQILELQADQIKNWYKEATEDIKSILPALGYYKAKVLTRLEKNVQHYHANFTVLPGPLLHVTHLNIAIIGHGRNNTLLKKAVASAYAFQGQVMEVERYQNIKKKIYQQALSEGYLNAHWKTHVVKIDKQAWTAEIELLLDTKVPYFIGPVRFITNSSLNHELLYNTLPFKTGERYSLNKVLAAEEQLQSTGYFSTTHVALPTESTKKLPLDIYLKKASKYCDSFGILYQTHAGTQFKFERLIRYLNDKGHQFAIRFQCNVQTLPKTFDEILRKDTLLQLQGTIVSTYTLPKFSFQNWQYQFQLYISQAVLSHIQTNLYRFRFLQVNRYRHWELKRFIDLHHEIFNKNLNSKMTDTFSGVICNFLLTYTKMSWFEAIHNHQLKFHTQVAFQPFSTINFFKVAFEGIYFRRMSPWSQLSYLVLRTQLGYILNSNHLSGLPPTLRFHAGGYHYPRGYPSHELGQRMVNCGLEYRQHITGALYCTPFFDLSSGDIQSTKAVCVGIGLGVWYPKVSYITVNLIFPLRKDKAYDLLNSIKVDF